MYFFTAPLVKRSEVTKSVNPALAATRLACIFWVAVPSVYFTFTPALAFTTDPDLYSIQNANGLPVASLPAGVIVCFNWVFSDVPPLKTKAQLRSAL